VYQHFMDMGNKDARGRYQERQYPRAMIYVPRVGLFAPDKYRGQMDQLDLAGIIMATYKELCEACTFERVNLYSRWHRYGNRKVRYLSERLLYQFGYFQTIP